MVLFIYLLNNLLAMTKAEQTRRFIIEKTAPLFNKKGYVGTSLSDITFATGLTKGSIYGNFKDKEEVALAVFKHNTEMLSKKIGDWIAEKKNAYDQLIGMIDFYRVNWKAIFANGGCPMLNAATESDDVMPVMKVRVKLTFENWEKKISKILDEGIKKDVFKQGINTSQYANLFIMMIEGGIVLSKISDKPDHLFLILDRIIKIVDDEIVK